MDAQYPFASREDIWRVQEEVKDLFAVQIEHGERISRLERRRDDDARMKSVWGPLYSFSGPVGVAHHQESSFNPTAEPFKGFDQTHQHGLTGALHLENYEEPRRGASRANSVRFDESSMYFSQANRSAAELLPLRTGSGLGSHPLTERSLSHRSDGKQSSSGQSHHSTLTNGMGFEASRLLGSASGNGPSATNSNTPLQPPPGLFILGPVPCIIRCWLTTNFSNDSLLYAAVCTGSYRSSISDQMVHKLGLEADALEEDGVRIIKLPVYLPEASVYQPSSRGGSPAHQLPTLTVRFTVRTPDPNDRSIQIFLGSDILRAHNADILFSQDKMLIVDNDRNKISIPLVRPEDDSTFRSLSTCPEPIPVATATQPNGAVNEKKSDRLQMNGEKLTTIAATTTGPSEPEMHGAVTSPDLKTDKPSTLSVRTSSDSLDTYQGRKLNRHFPSDSSDNSPDQPHHLKSSTSERPSATPSTSSAKTEVSGVWGPWRRDPNSGSRADNSLSSNPSASAGSNANSPFMSAYQRSTRTRNMKILKPSKPASSGSASSRAASGGTAMTSTTACSSLFGDSRSSAEGHDGSSSHVTTSANGSSTKPNSSDGSGAAGVPWSRKPRSANPVGGASAFGWLNSSGAKRDGVGAEWER
ncbi:hypothetical protein ACO22_07919 [Paracoccidioides brasiliensis]|uniref:Ubiquitin carboxyl-terminal hydrolase 19 n=1 Tax=Paracoccidioides brasiliensis TaxID=121759 RepID=A0A1D2J3B8_PARBR|nr:hypothetical protein ACO22_07919 [Paracoccidioides brasiliensis]